MSGPFPGISPAPALPLPDDPESFKAAAYPFTAFMHDLPDELNALAAAFATYVVGALTATSTSSIAIGAGAKTCTIGTGYAFGPGARVNVARTSDPQNSRMVGIVTDYTGGVLSFEVASGGATGSGTFTDWTITPAAEPTPQNFVVQAGKTGPYTTVLTDANTVIPMISGDFTVDGSLAYGHGSFFVVKNRNASSMAITLTSATLTQDVTGATGARTLLGKGTCTIWQDEDGTWWIGGDVT